MQFYLNIILGQRKIVGLIYSYHYEDGNRIGNAMISMLAMGVVDHGLEPWLVQTKDWNIGI
jgi:tetrahydromethanopterin S-methyltransferase subunit D